VTTVDPRLAAFCQPDGPEVFTAVVHGNQVFGDDPFDVDTIHAEARAAFRRLVDRAAGSGLTSTRLPPTGKTLLLLGEAGSGKTHLMRAFRTHVHTHGYGYCGYLQMTSRSEDYARYVLIHLVDSLQQPYRTGATGLSRLAWGVLDAVPTVTQADRDELVDGGLDYKALARLVHRLSSAVVQHPRFAELDLDVVRALLYVLADDGLVHALALKWLRCEKLSRVDARVLGGIESRPGSEMPLRTIVALGRVMWAVHSAALVLLVDQIEEVVELARRDETAGSVLRVAINTLVDVADALPNAVVVIACLEDLFIAARQSLPSAKLDRLEYDPEPVSLIANRTPLEVEALVARRMRALLEESGLDGDRADPLFPFTHADLAPLAGLRTRDVLGWCRRHHARCVAARGWVEPEPAVRKELAPSRAPSSSRLSLQWNDFLADWAPQSTLAESTLAELIGWAATAVTAETDDLSVQASVDGTVVSVSTAVGSLRSELLVAVCDVSSRGGALGRRIEEIAELAGSKPVAFVRSTPFPRDPKSRISTLLAALCRPVGTGRRVVVENADWRAIEAFRTFHDLHHTDPEFSDWLRQERPLSSLRGLRAVFDLDRLEAIRLDTIPGRLEPRGALSPELPGLQLASDGGIRLGTRRGVPAEPVELDPGAITRHVGFLGGGSNAAALVVVEELLLRGVPVLLLDRQGDLCRYADPSAWTEAEPDVRREELAQIPVDLYTPGANGGRPLALPLVPFDLHLLGQSDREQLASYAAAALGGLMGYRKRSHEPRRAILEQAIVVLAAEGGAVTVPRLESLVRERDAVLLASITGQHDDRPFEALADDLQTVWLRHRRLLDAPDPGNPIDAMLSSAARLSLVTTRFLGDEAVTDFWVSQLLLAIEHWRMSNPGEGLRAALLFDEVDRLMPAAGRVPTSRAALGNLLARGRAAGLGVLLVSPSPADLDDRTREQVGTWLVGQVEERAALARLRPVLEAANVDPDEIPLLGPGQLQLVQESGSQAVEMAPCLVAPRRMSEEQLLVLSSRPTIPGG
jgi:hypothetical protein